MAGTSVQIHGWKAVAILLAFAGFFLYRFYAMQTTLDTGAVEALKPWIAGRAIQTALQETGDRPFEQLTQEEKMSLSSKLLASRRVEIESISAHGLGENAVVRVSVLVDGKPMPDGRTVRYYRMRYSPLTGWTFKQEVTAFSYWLEIF